MSESISFEPTPGTSVDASVRELISDRPLPDLIRGSLLGNLVNRPHMATEHMLEEGTMNQAELENPDRLIGHAQPSHFIEKETPLHRIIYNLKLRGASNAEISRATGKTPVTVKNVVNQPWFQLRLVADLKREGLDGIRTLLRSTLEDSILTQVAMRDDPNTPAAVRNAICNSLEDRVLGKAVQPLETREITPDEAELDEKIARLQKQLSESRTFNPSAS